MKSIFYKKGYKYQLQQAHIADLHCTLSAEVIDSEYICLNGSLLVIKKGYAWDGPSGPTIDTKSFMRGSLVHDALYQLMRDGYLDGSYRKVADKILKYMCINDGMSILCAELVYIAVRLFARFAADPASKKPVERAP